MNSSHDCVSDSSFHQRVLCALVNAFAGSPQLYIEPLNYLKHTVIHSIGTKIIGGPPIILVQMLCITVIFGGLLNNLSANAVHYRVFQIIKRLCAAVSLIGSSSNGPPNQEIIPTPM